MDTYRAHHSKETLRSSAKERGPSAGVLVLAQVSYNGLAERVRVDMRLTVAAIRSTMESSSGSLPATYLSTKVFRDTSFDDSSPSLALNLAKLILLEVAKSVASNTDRVPLLLRSSELKSKVALSALSDDMVGLMDCSLCTLKVQVVNRVLQNK